MSGATWWAFEVIQEGDLMDGMNIFTVRIYKLFGKRGLVVNDMLPVETPVGDFIGYHNRKGGHGLKSMTGSSSSPSPTDTSALLKTNCAYRNENWRII
jgi:hypothetical protein